MKKYELVNFCEFDKYATKSYCAIHNVDESLNLGDITKVDETQLSEFNMICGGSPCQDFSIAGKQKGSVWKCKDCNEEYNPLQVHWSKRDKCPKCNTENLDKSRSSLLVEWLRVIRANKPNFGIYENVKNIVGKQFKETTFKIFEEELHEYGYNTYWKVLNAKNYGIPQNRERVYLILIKKELDNGKFKFPEGFDNGLRLKDFLEKEVDEKFYINNGRAKELIDKIKDGKKGQFPNIKNEPLSSSALSSREHRASGWNEGIGTLCARDYKDPKVIAEPIICEQRTDEGLRFFKDNICGALRTIDSCGDKRVIENTPNELQLFTNLEGDKWDKIHESARRVYSENGISPTIPTCQGGNIEPKTFTNYRIRKLIPKECWRLMGFSDEDFLKAEFIGISNTQLYKQAGNSIVVDVLYYIYKELYIAMPYLFDDLKLSSYFSGIGAFEKALDRLYADINNGVNFTRPQER